MTPTMLSVPELTPVLADAPVHRIARVRVRPCVQRQENPEWRFSGGRIADLPGWLVELETDQGAVGFGYVEVIPVVSTTPGGALAALQWLAPILMGRNPFDIEALLLAMDRSLAGHRHAKAGIDGALHELCAVILGQPLCNLFGGRVQGALELTRIIPLATPMAMAADGCALIAKGYRYLKVKLSGEVDLDTARVQAIREAVGSSVHLSVDPNQAYDAKGAIRCIRRIEAFGVDLIEQPVPMADVAGLVHVRRSTDMVVEADESVTSVAALLALIRANALDSANLKVADLGGLRNTLQCARLCEAAGIGYRIGATFGPRLMAAQSLHLATAFHRQTYAQEIAEFDHLLDDPFSGLEVSGGGTLTAGAAAGSGVALCRPAAVAWQLDWPPAGAE